MSQPGKRKIAQVSSPAQPPAPKIATRLVPKPVVPFAPVRQDERQHYLKLLHQQYPADIAPTERVARAVSKEYELASATKHKMEYVSSIKRVMFNLKKYGSETSVAKVDSGAANDRKTKLFSELNKLCISSDRLVRSGIVIDVPAPTEFDDMIECAHCKIKFSISQEYNEVAAKPITTCKFHPGKILTSLNTNVKKYNTHYASRQYSCCKETPGVTEGCQQLDRHVYKLQTAGQLQFEKPFITIKALSEKCAKPSTKLKAIGLDCEMCYTTRGFELMKLSVAEFPDGARVFDDIIKPEGEVIDLNTFVSGVDSIPDDAMTFQQMLTKLGSVTDENTVVIGHGLENDLNVLRVIYPKIVDTSILYSENTVDPRRKDPLKKLAWKYLSKNIQAGEHDSLEDALIPMQIVKRNLEKRLGQL